MIYEEKKEIVEAILNLAHKNMLSINQKNKLYDIVNTSTRTPIQKDRFIKYYHLDTNNNNKYNYTILAKEYNRTREAIKQSLHSVVIYTLLKDENIQILKKMLEEA